MPSECRIAFILPPREAFTPNAAGAIALVVQRLATATPGATVLGRATRKSRHCERSEAIQSFSGIPYQPAPNTVALIHALYRLNPAFIEIHQQPRLALILSFLFPQSKILLFLHNDPVSMRGLKTRFGRRLALHRLHRVVCVSAYLQSRYMMGLYGPAPAVLPNPLTLSKLPPRAEIRAKNILFAGRIVPDKGPADFITACTAALPDLPGWTATMMGGDRFGPDSPETPYVTQIRNDAAQAGIAVTGYVPHREVLDAMARAAIVVVPSRWPEPFGLTALEAAASGAVVIATTQGGLPEAAGPGAIYVPAGDTPALAAAIMAAAQDEAGWPARAAAGLRHAQNFDTPVIAARLEELRGTL